jgi:hypothetical protein
VLKSAISSTTNGLDAPNKIIKRPLIRQSQLTRGEMKPSERPARVALFILRFLLRERERERERERRQVN